MRVTGRGLNLNFEQEVPAGAVNGVNTVYTLAHTPLAPKAVTLWVDGIVQFYTEEFSVSGTTVTMTWAPAAGQRVYVQYPRRN